MSIFQFERILSVALVVVVICIAIGAGYLWYVETRDIPLETVRASGDQAVVLEGTYVCLPHTDGTKPKECTPGIKVDEEYYALDLAVLIESGSDLRLTNGTDILAAGVITPIEAVSSDQWREYPLQGVMQVVEVATQ